MSFKLPPHGVVNATGACTQYSNCSFLTEVGSDETALMRWACHVRHGYFRTSRNRENPVPDIEKTWLTILAFASVSLHSQSSRSEMWWLIVSHNTWPMKYIYIQLYIHIIYTPYNPYSYIQGSFHVCGFILCYYMYTQLSNTNMPRLSWILANPGRRWKLIKLQVYRTLNSMAWEEPSCLVVVAKLD